MAITNPLRRWAGLTGLLLIVVLAGCSASPAVDSSTPAGDAPAETVTAVPANTATPISTATPTELPTTTSTSTPTPEPSATPVTPDLPGYDGPGDYVRTVALGGSIRRFKVHIPPGYVEGKPMPLVFGFHGAGWTFENQEESSQMSTQADKSGFIVAYLDALELNDHLWFTPLEFDSDTDLNCVRELLAHLEATLSIDPARIYTTGFSMGGDMAQALACVLPDKIAAFAASGSGFFECDPGRPMSAALIHGLDDFPYHVGFYKAQQWAQLNDCDMTSEVAFQEGKVTARTWDDCAGGVAVIVIEVEGVGHVWPKPEIVTPLLWEFFAAHPMP